MSDLDVQGLDSVFSLQRNLETTRWSTEKTYIKEIKLLNADMYLAIGLFPLLDKIIKRNIYILYYYYFYYDDFGGLLGINNLSVSCLVTVKVVVAAAEDRHAGLNFVGMPDCFE